MTIRQFLMPLTLGALSLSYAWSQQYTISTYAGNGTAGFTGDSGAAISAELSGPLGLTFDSSGNLYIADSVNLRVRKISGGTISTVAGNGTSGFVSATNTTKTAATSADMVSPASVAVDSVGDIYIADTGNHVVWEVVNGSTATAVGVPAGTIIQIARDNTGGYSGDGGLAGLEELNFPTSVALDSSGNVYIADSQNNVIREVNTSGVINT